MSDFPEHHPPRDRWVPSWLTPTYLIDRDRYLENGEPL